jgi:hypothetical protein
MILVSSGISPVILYFKSEEGNKTRFERIDSSGATTWIIKINFKNIIWFTVNNSGTIFFEFNTSVYEIKPDGTTGNNRQKSFGP